MSEWLQNTWVVGIGGGIISGLIVFLVTRWLFSNQSKDEFTRKIASANREITFAVRQGIPEGRVPSHEVLNSLIKATARKHGLSTNDLYGPAEVAQDLIKDVMDSSFISAEAKENYCLRLVALNSSNAEPPIEQGARTAARSVAAQTAMLSVTLATISALMTMSLLFFRGEELFASTNQREFLVSIAMPVAAIALGVAFSVVLRLAQQARRKRQRGNLMLVSAEENRIFGDGKFGVEHLFPKD